MPPRPPAPKSNQPAKPGRSTPLDRTRSGKLKSKRAKIGGECSQAMSDWKTKGMSPAIAATLGKCRARARLQRSAEGHAGAGREGMAANLQRRSEGQYVTVKERLARAKELRAQRAGRAPAQAAPKAEPVASGRAQRMAERAASRSRDGSAIRQSEERVRSARLAYERASGGRRADSRSAMVPPAILADARRAGADRADKLKQEYDAAQQQHSAILSGITSARLARARDLRAQRAQRQAQAGPKAEPVAPAKPARRAKRGTPKRLERASQLRAERQQKQRQAASSAAMANARRRFGDSEAEIRQSTAETVRDFRKGKETYYTNYGSGGYGGKITREALGAPITAEIREKTTAVVARVRAQRAARTASIAPQQPGVRNVPDRAGVREAADRARAAKGRTPEERLTIARQLKMYRAVRANPRKAREIHLGRDYDTAFAQMRERGVKPDIPTLAEIRKKRKVRDAYFG